MTTKRFFKKTGKILLYFLGSVLLLVVLAWIFINTDYGKRIVRNKIEAYLEKKLNTKVVIGEIDYSLPKWVEIKNLYVEDRAKDTLLFGEKLAVDLDMIKLIRGNTYIRKVEFKNIYANIKRGETDSFFNFQFIVDAFAGNQQTTAKVNPDTAAMKLTLKRLILDNVLLKFSDKNAGSDFNAYIKNLDATITKFQPDRLQFDVDKFITDGMNFSMVNYKKKAAPVTKDTAVSLPPALLLTAGLLDLRNVNVEIDDKTNGMYYKNNIRHIGLDMLDLDLAREKATGNKLLLDSSLIRFVAPKPEVVVNTKDSSVTIASNGWDIALKEVSLKDNIFRFDDNAKPFAEGLDFAHLSMNGINFNGTDVHYTPDSTLANITQLSFKDTSGFRLDTTHALIAYTSKGITTRELYVKTPGSLVQHTVAVTYDDIAQLATAPENSSVDIQLANSTIAINDIYMLVPSVKKFMEPQKFANSIVRLNTTINGSLGTMNIPVLQFAAFDGTVVNAKAILYNVTNMDKLGYDITIFNSTIPRSDLSRFLPNSREALAKLPPVINISTNIKGNLDDATGIFNITSSSFRLYAKGNIKHIKNPDALQYNLAIKDSRVDKSFLSAILPPNTIPPNITLPTTITVSGTAKGDMNNIQPDLKLGGSYGTVAVKGYVKNFKNQQAATYDLRFATSNFAVGRLIQQDSLIGNVTMTGTAKGRGFDYRTMRSAFTAEVQSAGFKGYTYQDASLDAVLNNGNISSSGKINDPNVRLDYIASGNIGGTYPSNVEATVNIDTVRLQKLNLYKDSLDASLKFYVKAPSTDPRNLDVFAYTDSSRLTINNKTYILDSIVTVAKTANGSNDITLRSPFADLKATGSFEYDKIGQSIARYIDKYYNIGNTSGTESTPQQISFQGIVKKHPLVMDLVPGLQYENIPFKGSYASQGGDSALNLSATVPYFSYAGNTVSSGNIDIVSTNDRINGNVNFDTLRFANNTFYKTNITANAANDSLGVAMITKDQKGVDRFGIGANIKIDNGEAYTFSMKPDLILNYKRWNVAPNNRIVYSPEGVLVNNFNITSDSASISANSTGALNSPVDVTIDNFNIREITSFLNRDTLLASGILDGKFMISDFNKQLPSFTGNLALTQAEYKQQPIGDIKMFAEKRDDNSVRATIDLTGNGNDLSANGHYYLNNINNEFDAELDIRKLQLATLQAFSNGALVRSSGSIRGDLALNGKFSDPRWNGDIAFDTARFTLAEFGTPYFIDKQNITLNYPELEFNKFTIKDSANNPLVINGTIREKQLTEYDLNLQINAKNFMLVNTPRALNSQVFGFAAIDADIVVTGNSTSPDIQGNVSLNDKSDVTIILPESNINKDAAQSVVRFIDRDTFALPETFVPAVEKKISFGQFINYNLNIEVTKNAALTIVIDPSTGDELRVQGDAQLNAGVNPNGGIVLTGNYELNKGYYLLNYQFLRRQFNLLPGSTITFSGEPTDAQVNVTAVYVVNTSAKELLSNEVAGMDARMANTFNQKLPFNVILYLKGPIKKPEISFDIQMPDENTQVGSQLRSTIGNKLTQLRDDVAAMNKQVFSLLLLNRFVGEQSSDFFKGNGSFDQLARESVSKFLSSALDQIADDLFKGVDVDLNVNTYEDYSTGDAQQKTDLNVAVTKTFLDDRLSITVGKNFGIEGQDATAKASQKPSNLPDVTINYKLTKDGKYSIRAYKKNQFEVILDGYVVETGVAFVVTMDYDKFRELFSRKK